MITKERWEMIQAHAARHVAEGFVDNDVSILLAEIKQTQDALALAASNAPDIYDAATREQRKRRVFEGCIEKIHGAAKRCLDGHEGDALKIVVEILAWCEGTHK